MLGELITGAANVLGGMVAANSAKTEGERAAQIQRETNAMQINLANTAHQREMRDLKAAGLNPLLTAMGGQGSSTPTLSAPIQGATGGAKAGAEMGNMMINLSSQIMQFMSGQQQIELQRANADTSRAEAERIKETTKWITPKSQMDLQQGQQQVIESTQRTKQSQAQTATIESLRIPQVKQLLQQVAESVQRTKTEEQKTIEQTQIANYAKQLWGARASEAATLASQAATYYKEYFLKRNNQAVDKENLEIELLKNKNFQQLITNILDNEYGRMERWTNNFSSLTKTGAVIGAPKGNVTTNPYK